MATRKHVFISANGALLPRWKQAFAKATVYTSLSSMAALTGEAQADFIWLRLQSGATAAQQIAPLTELHLNAALIVLSDLPNDDEAMTAFALGARGYANSHASAETLKQIAKVVEQGGLWIGVTLMQRLLVGVNKLPHSAAERPANQHKLTEREMEVARAIASGASNKEVARQLNITERTVKAHVSGLFTKLAVSDRLQLALKIRELS